MTKGRSMSSQSSDAEPRNEEARSARSRSTEQMRRTHRAAVIVGGVVPLVIVVVATAVMVSWLPELPSPVATHWGATGGPDGFGSAWTILTIPLPVSLGFGALAVGFSWSARPSGLLGGGQKLLLVTSVFLSGLLSSLALWALAIQRGLSDASQAPSITPAALAAAAIGLVLAAIGWFLLPRMDNSLVDTEWVDAEEPEPLRVGPSERVAWSKSIRITGGILVLLGAVVVVLCGALIVPFSTGSQGPVIPIVVVVFVTLVAVGTSFWRVSVDYRGLVVRSLLGWPRFTIRPGDIRSVHVVQINPVADFGGWGWRWVGGRRVGIIMRAGEAIEVTRQSGSVFVVTVDDAETGVSVLAALAAQSQKGAHPTGSRPS
jgi:uncharacterized membrane protein